MSLFRKPKKIQRRVFCADDDDEVEAEPEPPPPPIISYEKKESKPSKKTKSLLSFVDEEEDGEVFKVKKSSQSKRLAKLREKEKRRAPDGDNNKYDNNVTEDKSNNIENEHKPKSKQKVTLEGLILSGREALAADGAGDVSDDSVVEEEEDSRGFHQYRAESVRAALAVAPGHIPDAALIHAARKTRQQAREFGDFVPLQTESTPGSRLVRDDGSGDEDDDEGRLHVRGLELPSDKPKRGTAAAASEDELDSEGEVWVEQQMQKAMPAITDITGDGVELNPFAVAPPPPPPRLHESPHLRPLAAPGRQPASAQDLVHALHHRLEELQMDRDETRARRDEVVRRLQAAAAVRRTRAARRAGLDAAYRRAQAARGYLTDLVECLDEKMPALQALEARALALHRRRCEFLQERRRADVRDQAQDALALAARPGAAKPVDSEEKIRRAAEREGRRRARRLQRAAAAAAAGATPRHRDGDSSDDDLPPAEHQHYQQERETIKQMSSSLFADALPAWRSVAGVCARLARFRRRSRALYCDAYVAHCLPQLLAPYVRHQLILWNPLADEDNEDYEKMDWYKCLMMYGVRAERLSSESEQSDDEEEAEDVTVTETTVREDPDLYLVPTIINKLVLPKLTELVEQAWDPMCVRACVRLRHLVLRAAGLPPPPAAGPDPAPGSGPGPGAGSGPGPGAGPGSGPDTAAPAPPLRRLALAVRARLAATINADVFLPTLPPQAMEGAGGLFWRRCAGGAVRLLRGTLALAAPPALLRADALVLALLETVCCAAGAAAAGGGAGAGAVAAAGAAAALAASLPRAGQLRARALPRLAALAQHVLQYLHSDNPMHLKALEQARSLIAEARALE